MAAPKKTVAKKTAAKKTGTKKKTVRRSTKKSAAKKSRMQINPTPIIKTTAVGAEHVSAGRGGSVAAGKCSLMRCIIMLTIGILLGGGAVILTLRFGDGTILSGIIPHDRMSVSVEEEIDPDFIRDIQTDLSEDLQDIDLDNFWEVWQIIEKSYTPKPINYSEDSSDRDRPNSVTRQKLIDGAVRGLASATGDRYTNYLPPKSAHRFKEEVLDGEVDGIVGIYVSIRDDQLTIVDVIKRAPAAYAGIKKHDVILAIDTIDTSAHTLDEAIKAIRGPRDTPVLLKIYRPSTDEEFSVTILRDRVDIPTVETEIRDGVFIIHLLTFTKQTPSAFRNALKEFATSANAGGPQRLLLNLQGNSGGILSVAAHIANLFLPEKSTIFYEYSGDEKLQVYRSKKPIFKNNIWPVMTIAVDGGTASASEVLAAALRHYGIADIVGTRTEGKGSVQAVRNIGDGESVLKVTVAYWLKPDKKIVSPKGLVPDNDLKETLEAIVKENPDLDIEQYILTRAIEHLKAK